MGVEDGNDGNSKIPQIKWQGDLNEEEVAQRNAESAKRLKLGDRGEQNRRNLLKDISPELIEVTRAKAEQIVAASVYADQVEALRLMDELIRTLHPAQMLTSIHAISLASKSTQHISDLAVALAFLALTEEPK